MEAPRNTPDAETLLRESVWIRRLARSLLGDAHAAEDLSQEVLTAALLERPAFSGPRLRGWLAVVTRRLAAGGRARERRRGEVERRAACPEEAGSDAHDRLVLHRALAGAIDSLPAPYRETLVLRYLDGLPPRTIARRQGLPATTVRKRVSRGLAMLRARLDEDFADPCGQGGRSAWSLACAGLLRQAPEVWPLWPAGVIGMGVFSKLVATLAVALVVFLAITRPWDPAALTVPLGREEVAPIVREGTEAARAEPPSPDEVGGERVALATPSAEATGTAPRLRVVDEAGEPLLRAKAAWLDARGRILPVEFDGVGSAPLLEEWEGARVYAAHAGLVPGHAPLESDELDLVLTLAKGIEVAGRIVEAGGTPRRPLHLRVLWNKQQVSGIEWEFRRLEGQLERRGLLRTWESLWTEPDGSFRFCSQHAGVQGTLWLPNSHLLADPPRHSETSETRLSIVVDGTPLLVETILLPIVEGRLAWSDDGSAVEDGRLLYQLADSGGNPSPGGEVLAAPDGRFAIGVDIEGWRTMSSEQRGEALAGCGTLHLRGIRTTSKSALSITRDVPLAKVSFPLDIGTIELDRARRVAIRVLAADGSRLEGAAIQSAVDSARSDGSGEAELSCQGGPTEEIVVLAPGHALGRFPLGDAPAAPGETWELRLEPGIELVFQVIEEDGALPEGVKLEVSWEETPYQRSEGCDAPCDSLHSMLDEGHRLWGGLKSVTFDPDPEGQARMLALLPGKRLKVRLLHEEGTFLLAREITTPERPGVETITLVVPAGPPPGSVVLRGRIQDELGSAIPHASVGIVLGGGRRLVWYDCDERGEFESGPLEPGVVHYQAQAKGHVELERTAVELMPGSAPLNIVLPRSRKVEVRVRDETGRVLKAQKVSTTAGSGRVFTAHSDEPGLVEFDQLPREPLELELLLGGGRYRRELGAEDLELTITLPAHGTLVASFADEELLPDTEVLILVVESPDGGAPLRVENRFPFREDAPGRFAVEVDLRPGSWRARVLSCPEAVAEDEVVVETVLLSTREVTLEAGERTVLAPGG